MRALPGNYNPINQFIIAQYDDELSRNFFNCEIINYDFHLRYIIMQTIVLRIPRLLKRNILVLKVLCIYCEYNIICNLYSFI
jgi:hypothetical protein